VFLITAYSFIALYYILLQSSLFRLLYPINHIIIIIIIITKCELEELQFLEDQRKELVMLNCYPISKRMFVHFNAALTSSAPVERSFGFAGIITRPHRRKLSDTMFEKLLILKENLHFLFLWPLISYL
jgi:hypothetical protein